MRSLCAKMMDIKGYYLIEIGSNSKIQNHYYQLEVLFIIYLFNSITPSNRFFLNSLKTLSEFFLVFENYLILL